MSHDEDTIYAVASGAGKSAVAVIRISGPECIEILQSLCARADFEDRRATLALVRDEQGKPLDRALVIRFSAPASYTGEDLVELQVTGSRAVVSGILRALAFIPGTRPAQAGEFARRAFENGKLDLVEVEGLAAVVEAETRAQLRNALAQASGGLSRRCEVVRGMLLSVMAETEAVLDFSDVEDASEITLDRIRQTVATAKAELHKMLDQSVVSQRLRDGMVVVIAGAPNVGKSTLLNCIADRDVAIVSPHPGTTRDVLEISAEIDGYPITFVDTAGLREPSDPVEAEGISRAQARSSSAVLVLWIYENENDAPPPSGLTAALQLIRTKADVRIFSEAEDEVLSISARTGAGIPELLARVSEHAKAHFDGYADATPGTERQRAAVRDALAALEDILPEAELELVAENLRHAADAMGRVTGRIGVEEVLGEIFSRLCVGK